MSGVTDCYQPVEAKLKLTRRCLEVLAEFRNPVFIITKNRLVTRDMDLLVRTGAASGGGGLAVHHHAGCRIAQGHGTAHVAAGSAAGGDP